MNAKTVWSLLASHKQNSVHSVDILGSFETPAELEQLTPEYEQQRNLNIQRNNAFMESLRLTSLTSTKIVNKQKGISRQKKDATDII